MSRVRASEHEREKTIRVLHDGCADGRLSTSTLEQRVERALAARSVDELRQLTLDVKRVPRVRAWLSQTLSGRSAAVAPEGACLWLEGIGKRPFVFGRSRASDLVLAGDTVSRRHAQIARSGDRFVLRDLGSLNGTWLGGRRVGQVEVAAGDVIELGDVPVRLL
jgi:hypothetical protein